MKPDNHCPECGSVIPDGQPKALCPHCALNGVLKLAARRPERPLSTDETSAFPDQVQRDFGDYELLEEIARGGMGIVYRARQKSLDRIVAVKLLLLGQYASEEFIHRFRIEASAAASLRHPNIVAIHEVGVHQGQHYFAMDFVDGPDLAQLVRDQPLTAKRAASYVKTIAEAIHFAHTRRILHRDLKPSNVLIDSNGQPRVTDFGLAKNLASDSELTLTGQVIGSPSFMPPEQALGKRSKMGPASDVYSLGAILYHALTGRPPFMGETLNATLQQLENKEPIAPRLLVASVPTDLETICLRCLEKEPAQRFQSAQELAEELARFLRDEPIHSRPVSAPEKIWRWCRRKPALATTLILLQLVFALGLAGIVWQWRLAEKARATEAKARQQAERALARLEASEQKDATQSARSAQEAQFMQDLLRGPGASLMHGRNPDLLREILATAPPGGYPQVEVVYRKMLALILESQGRIAEALWMYRNSAADGNPDAWNSLAWLLATGPEPGLRNGPEAVGFAEKAVAANDRKDPAILDTLAAAYAEAGQFAKAISVQQEAIDLLKYEDLKADYAFRLKLYESRSPYREHRLLGTLTRVRLGEKRFREAELLARECMVLREKEIPDDVRTFNTRTMLGESLLGQNEFAEAEPLLLSGYVGMKQRENQLSAEGRILLKEALQSLVQLYEEMNRPGQVAEWKERLAEFDRSTK
jgi:hypothetical protein